MNKDDMILWAAKQLAEGGARVLQKDPALTEEAISCIRALIADRPSDVLESPICDEITMMAGVALGIALKQSDDDIEAAGGFDKLTKAMKDGGIETLVAKLADSQ